MNTKAYRRDCVFGALGALFMLAGDLCLSIVPASEGDSGLFAREAYLNGGFQSWRLPLLLATGLIGMALGFFTVRAFYSQIDEKFKKTRMALLIGGVVYVASAGVLHFFIGSLADWTGKLAPILGREDTFAMIEEQYTRLMPAMYISYAGMFLFALTNFFAVVTKKTALPQKMILFHMLVWQLVLVLIPDIRQLLGAELLGAGISTWDFVVSQSSVNASLFIWLIANAVRAGKQKDTEVG